MARYSRVVLHENGPALWPERKPLDEVLDLRDTTPANIWIATYQGVPTSPAGTVFLREWWHGQNRYDITDRKLQRRAIRRWISWDTAGTTGEAAAYSCGIVFELWPDYRVAVRDVLRARLTFPELPPAIERLASKWFDPAPEANSLAAVIIEDRATGGPAVQTLQANAADWLTGMLWAFQPDEDKVLRAHRAAVWCRQACVLLPEPSDHCRWLPDFENELFDFPESAFKDQVDAFSQGIWALRHQVHQGFVARRAAAERMAWKAKAEQVGVA